MSYIELTLFNKERYRAERKIAQNLQDIEKAEENKRRMSEDWRYIAEYKEVRTISIIGMQQATSKEIGQELHIIAKRYRGEDWKNIRHYMGLNLSVRSEYHFSGSFDRNIFCVEGLSGLKYECGLSGALPLSFVESADYPKATLEKIPVLIDRQYQQIDRLTNELPTLQQIMARQWNKSDELSELKQECSELQNKIDESLKQIDQQPVSAVGDAA